MWTWPLKMNLTGTATVIVGTILVVGAAGAWIKDNAEESCNANWQVALSKAEKEFLTRTEKYATRIRELEKQTLETEARVTAEVEQRLAETERQREVTPLSADCDKCRIPNDWIWVRPDGTPGAVQGRTTTQSRRAAPNEGGPPKK